MMSDEEEGVRVVIVRLLNIGSVVYANRKTICYELTFSSILTT